MKDVIFESKRDQWLVIVLNGSTLINLILSIALVYFDYAYSIYTIPFLIIIGVALPQWILHSTRYTFKGDTLHITSGPLRVTIPLKSISSLTPTNDMLSSPALSLTRLRINYAPNRSIMVSPTDQEAFIKELEQRKSLP